MQEWMHVVLAPFIGNSSWLPFYSILFWLLFAWMCSIQQTAITASTEAGKFNCWRSGWKLSNSASVRAQLARVCVCERRLYLSLADVAIRSGQCVYLCWWQRNSTSIPDWLHEIPHVIRCNNTTTGACFILRSLFSFGKIVFVCRKQFFCVAVLNDMVGISLALFVEIAFFAFENHQNQGKQDRRSQIKSQKDCSNERKFIHASLSCIVKSDSSISSFIVVFFCRWKLIFPRVFVLLFQFDRVFFSSN